MSKNVGKIPRGPRILLSLLATNNSPMSAREIAAFVGTTNEKVAPYLTRLSRRGLVKRYSSSAGSSWKMTRAGRVLANGEKKIILELAAMLEAR